MTKNERDKALEYVLDTRSGDTSGTDQPFLNDGDRTDFESLLEVADVLWEAGHGAPPLDQDPVAAMLGLVPDPGYRLDPGELSRVRKKSKLKVSELAQRLSARGWQVGSADLFRWESQGAAEVSPALVSAIAEELGVDTDQIVARDGGFAVDPEVSAATGSSRFQALAQRWARMRDQTLSMATSTLQSRMLTTVHRGERPNAEQMLDSLEQLVTAMEEGQDG